MKAKFYLVYAIVAYLVGLANTVYIVGFLADVGVPKGINDGSPTPLWRAVAIDSALVLGFGLHHSITARASFKRWWTKLVPAPIERATYLYMTAVTSAVLVVLWRPIPITIWEVQSVVGQLAIYGLYLSVWALMLWSTFAFGHFDFFGLSQAWARFRERPPANATMSVRFLYAFVRHPISVGWMTAPLIVPHLTVGNVVFAVATFGYVMAATPFEEADLVEDLGDEYREYRKRVPAFVPAPVSLLSPCRKRSPTPRRSRG